MKKKLLLFLILNLFLISAYAQDNKIVDNSEKKSKIVYINVLKTYERIVEKGYKSADLYQKLGNGYYTNSELDKASRWYCELFAITSNLELECYYRYIETLKAAGNNDEANKIIEKFNKESSKYIKEKT